MDADKNAMFGFYYRFYKERLIYITNSLLRKESSDFHRCSFVQFKMGNQMVYDFSL